MVMSNNKYSLIHRNNKYGMLIPCSIECMSWYVENLIEKRYYKTGTVIESENYVAITC